MGRGIYCHCSRNIHYLLNIPNTPEIIYSALSCKAYGVLILKGKSNEVTRLKRCISGIH
jgi:hypothetical protein